MKKIPFGDPGVASFASDEYGQVPLLTGDVALLTSTESVGADADLPIYSVVGRAADGNLALATAFFIAAVAAKGTLAVAAQPAAGESVTIGGTTYTFRAALTGANDVLIGADTAASVANLIAAINAGPGEGEVYGTGTVAHPDAIAFAEGTTSVDVYARVAGEAGNSIATTETLAAAGSAFGSATLTGGANSEGVPPVGITTAPVKTGAGASTTVDVYRSGMFNPAALNWHHTFSSDAEKKAAFEGSVSPNIYIQKAKYQDTFA